MKNKIGFYLFLTFFFLNFGTLHSQTVQILPPPINIPGLSVKSPYISYDGTKLVFILENRDSSVLAESSKNSNGTWSKPHSVDAINKFTEKPFYIESPTYNQDVTELYFSLIFNAKDSTSDIYKSIKIGGNWQKPIKLPKPINSEEYESDPCISPDGKTLYFVRYFDNPSINDFQCTRIYFSH